MAMPMLWPMALRPVGRLDRELFEVDFAVLAPCAEFSLQDALR